ncbi:MAG: hypothetical protein WKF37_11915 [Bryobacteraceae bacterium]
MLSLIQSTPTAPQTDKPDPPRTATDSSAARPKKSPASATGKRTQVFLHEGDRRIIRELIAYLAGQGLRVSESLIIKAALRTAKPGDLLLRAYQEAASQDQRFKEHDV